MTDEERKAVRQDAIIECYQVLVAETEIVMNSSDDSLFVVLRDLCRKVLALTKRESR
jgi:hypothetical protein